MNALIQKQYHNHGHGPPYRMVKGDQTSLHNYRQHMLAYLRYEERYEDLGLNNLIPGVNNP
uniref:Rws1 n=1 Tax=Arundo donax TaxID=35708 RepID=A0A0A8XU31_ARUDO